MLILRMANRISQVVEAKAFSVFDCTRAPRAAWETHILRIANAISQQGDALKTQWEDIMPRARHAVSTLQRDYASNKDNVCANKKALRQAITRIQSHHATREMHPVDILRKAVILYILFGLSTSGVEQSSARFF